MPPDPGTIIILNGPSSAGKTTLAHALRDARPSTIATIAIDQLFASAPPTHPNNWHLFATLTDATFAAAASLARGGFHVVVDTVFERPDCLATARSILAAHRYHLVAVTCALDLLESRERARANRRPGQARDQHARVLQNATYNLHLDTGTLSVEDCVARLLQLLPRST